MSQYIIRRSASLFMTLFITSILIFALTQLLPGDVARLTLGREASTSEITAFNERFGLDQPIVMQYVNWLTGFVTGNWGRSFTSGNAPIQPFIVERFGNSVRLAGFTMLISIPISIFLGVIAALTEDSQVDNVISVISLSVVGLPEFVTGLVLINLFAIHLGWFDSITYLDEQMSLLDWVKQLTLPAITASLVLIGYITRMTRAGMADELKKSYVRTAILKGLPQHVVIIKHVLRNALLPTITVIAISIGWLMGGLVIIENIFNYPGLGSALVRAVDQKNTPMIQAITLIIVAVFAVSNLIADLLYAMLNPRIRLE